MSHPKTNRHSGFAHGVKSIVVFGLLLGFSVYLEKIGFFEPFAAATYDWNQRIAKVNAPRRDPAVTVFSFGSDNAGPSKRSNPTENEVLQAIRIIACGRPAVIGVDWRSGGWSPRGLDTLRNGPVASTPIVWAREILKSGEIGRVAGGVSLPANWKAGIAEVVADPDHSVRRHNRWIPPHGPSFPWLLLQSYCSRPGATAPGCALAQRCPEAKGCEQEILLDIRKRSDEVNEFPAESLLALTRATQVQCEALPQAGANPFIRDHIVLIGDASGSDSHDTPAGRKLGVHIMAHAVQVDLFGDAVEEHHGFLAYFFHVLCAIFVVVINRMPWPFLSLALNIAGIPAVALISSYLAFHSWHHWINFAPILGGVVIHQLFEQAETNHKLRHKIAELERTRYSKL